MGSVLYEGNGIQVKRSHGGPKGPGVVIGTQEGSVWLSLEQVADVISALTEEGTCPCGYAETIVPLGSGRLEEVAP